MLEEEARNGDKTKIYLLFKQLKETEETNTKLAEEIKEAKSESKRNKNRFIISTIIAVVALLLSIFGLIF